MALGRAIHSLRVQRGMSQEELALRADLARKTVYQMEGGLGNPRYASLLRISAALDVRVGELTAQADALEARATRRRRR